MLLSVKAVDAFTIDMFSAFQANPLLSKMTETKTGDKFTVRMDIGNNKKDETHLFLDGLSVELRKDAAPADNKVGLPGADGPHPKTSTGALAVDILKTPHFIDMFGTQKVRFEKGCWEMIWRKNQQAGSVILGFHLPSGARRNGASLPSGRIYMSFPVWSEDGLATRQKEKTEAEAKVKEFNKEKDDELKKYQEASNLFMKALHYRNAVAAVEKVDLTGIRFLNQVPSESEVIAIGGGVLVNTKGTIWSKENNFFGEQHVLLGDAVLCPFVEKDENTLMP